MTNHAAYGDPAAYADPTFDALDGISDAPVLARIAGDYAAVRVKTGTPIVLSAYGREHRGIVVTDAASDPVGACWQLHVDYTIDGGRPSGIVVELFPAEFVTDVGILGHGALAIGSTAV